MIAIPSPAIQAGSAAAHAPKDNRFGLGPIAYSHAIHVKVQEAPR